MDKSNWKYKIGLVLIIVSTLIFAFLLFIPFLATSDKDKILITTVTIVIAEILFCSGGLLLGRQLFDKYKSYLNTKNWFTGPKSG